MATSQAMLRAKEAARKALEIDESMAEAHVEMGTVSLWYDWDWAAAQREFRRATELRPDYAPVHEFQGWALVSVGRFEEGLAANKRALELDPRSAEISEVFGHDLYFARQYDQAIQQLRAALDLDPNYWFARVFLGLAYERQGNLTQALAELEKARLAQPHVSLTLAELGYAYAVLGKPQEAERLIRQLEGRWNREHIGSYNVATLYFGLGDTAHGFSWLEKAYQEHSWYLTWLKVEPRFDSLHPDPRFHATPRDGVCH
jgi:eukaryotic-like serine/threonine-protein kinase